jgi:hypothetical protein
LWKLEKKSCSHFILFYFLHEKPIRNRIDDELKALT